MDIYRHLRAAQWARCGLLTVSPPYRTDRQTDRQTGMGMCCEKKTMIG